MVAEEEVRRGELGEEFGISRYKLLQTEWMEKEVLLYSTASYIQHRGINHNGKEYKKNVHICITERQKLTQHCTSSILQKKKNPEVSKRKPI